MSEVRKNVGADIASARVGANNYSPGKEDVMKGKNSCRGTVPVPTVLLAMAVLLLLTGCGAKSMLCSVPEASGSVVCKLAGKMDTSPEAISKALKIANAGGMTLKIYEAQEAERFIDDIIREVEAYRGSGEITYLDAVNYIRGKHNKLSPEVQVLFEVIDPGVLSKKLIEIPLTDYDFELILKHLNAQKRIVAAFKAIAYMSSGYALRE